MQPSKDIDLRASVYCSFAYEEQLRDNIPSLVEVLYEECQIIMHERHDDVEHNSCELEMYLSPGYCDLEVIHEHLGAWHGAHESVQEWILGGVLASDDNPAARINVLANPTLGQPPPGSASGQWGSNKQPFWRPGANPTVDLVVTRAGKSGDEVLLIRRADKPGVAEAGKWALPGGFHDTDARKGEPWVPGRETASQAALRELAEETQLEAHELEEYMRHLGFYDRRGRDPRDNPGAWAVSNAFALHLDAAHAARSVAGSDDADQAEWVDIEELHGYELAFDHVKIAQRAGLIEAPER